MARPHRTLFLLSPASLGGDRARILLREAAAFPLARQLRSATGAPLGEVFAFLSGLYFRGKATYARAFARPPRGTPGALVITAGGGLVDLDQPVDAAILRAMAEVPIDERERRYLEPLMRDAIALERRCGPRCRVVLLGSVATGKYVEPLQGIFGERLLFPTAFVGRGDMSRGGLLLRCADAGLELDYAPIAGAVRHGARPAKLPPRRSSGRTPIAELAILIGFPGAGKSTFYAERLATTHVHVSKDAMPRSADKGTRQRGLLETALRAGRSAAVDNVNATRAERAELITIAAAAGARVVGYWLDAPPRICLDRNRERSGRARVPPVAIFAAAKRFEPPTPEEGFAVLWRVRPTGTRETPAFEVARLAR